MRDPRKFLSDVPVNEVFRAHDGRSVKNLYELLHLFKEIDKSGFKFHSSREREDFIKWIESCVKDKDLAEKLQRSKRTRKEFISILEKRIKNYCLRRSTVSREKRQKTLGVADSVFI